VLFGFAARGTAYVAAMQPMRRGPGLGDDRRRRTVLALAQRLADKGVVPIVPGGFDEHAADVGVAGFGDGALRAFGPARVLGRDQADKGHRAGRRRKPTRVAELGGNRQRREVVDAAEAAEALHARPARLEVEQGGEILFDRAQAGERFVDGAEVGAMGLLQRGDRPRLAAEPEMVPLRPGLLGRGEPSAVAKEDFRQTMTRPQQVGADVLAAPQEIAGGFFLLGGNVNRRPAR
jgi:hypothetical protein